MYLRAMIALLVVLVPVSGYAGASIEAGVTPLVGLNYEGERFSLGIGLGFSWEDMEYLEFMGGELSDVDVFVFVVKPEVHSRLFFNTGSKVQPLLVAKVGRDLPFAQSDSDALADSYEDTYKYWHFSLGAGARAFLADDWAIGGEAVMRTSVLDETERMTKRALGSGGFDVYLQHHF